MEISHCYLDGNADAVEFCPHRGFEGVLAASTYNLIEGSDSASSSRHGSISLFDVDVEEHRLELVHRVKTAGVFDISWNPVGDSTNGSPLLAQADADGYLRIYRLLASLDGSKGITLEERNSIQVSSTMCLYVGWHPSSTSLCIGLSDGSISIVSVSESQLNVTQNWKAHDFELWTAIFDTHQPSLVYTGSDDCRFCCWDLREGPSFPVFRNSKAHSMGVTCIVKDPNNPHALLTGSYDEQLRLWDVRSTLKPVNETSMNLGGGVWRIKYHPFIPDLVLTACMHNGFAIVRLNGKPMEVAETYGEHKSLAYGADWQGYGSSGERKVNAVATCSFYDQLLRVWIPKLDDISSAS